MKTRDSSMVRSILRRPKIALQASIQLPALLVKVAIRYHASPIWVVRRALELISRLYLPYDGFRLGLFDPSVASGDLRRFMSRRRFKLLRETHNPAPWVPLVKDKGIFYRFCETAGVPTPTLHAIMYREVPGWSRSGVVPAKVDLWKNVFLHDLPNEFVAKPTWAQYGHGFFVLRRDSGAFVDHTGKRWDVQSLVRFLQFDPDDRGYVIQERLRNEKSLERLAGTEALQTVRVMTFVEKREVVILGAYLKIIVGPNVVDNTEGGKTGNIAAAVDIESGTLGRAIQYAFRGAGVKHWDVHSGTGELIRGFALPFWPQVCSLSRETALKFMPLRAVGWDVAITPAGPKIMEGNAWYDPPNYLQDLDEMAHHLESDGSGASTNLS